jgi:hypothetical protein
MARRVVKELTYHAGVDEVAAMLADPAFRERVLDRQRVVRGTVSIDGDRVRIEQVQATDGIPAFARRFAGDEIAIHQQERWLSPTSGDITVTVPGKPGEMKGTAVLSETGGVTTETVDLEVSVRIPLAGGKIEGLLADMLSRAMDKEHEVGVEWLRGER